MLVTSLGAFVDYHAVSAQVWERQALLRARPVAGSQRLGAAFDEVRREILGRPLPDDAAAEIARLRGRTERELGRETAGRYDFKAGRGGMQDVETIVQLLQLRHGHEAPRLFDPTPMLGLLARLAADGRLAPADAGVLADGWAFLQQLSARLRILDNRSISSLERERGDLDAVARSLGYPESERGGGARRRLLEDYRRHTDDVRAVYQRLVTSDA
jgi:glutamate-ammonia-ligase adenylyltransferase